MVIQMGLLKIGPRPTSTSWGQKIFHRARMDDPVAHIVSRLWGQFQPCQIKEDVTFCPAGLKRRAVKPAACASQQSVLTIPSRISTVRRFQQKHFFEAGSILLIKIQNMPLKIGIAFYIQEGNNRAGPPHWALVAHPISYSAPDVMVFQIRQVLASSWSLAHTVCSLSNTSSLLGVLHVAEISMTSAVLNQFVAQFPATKNGDDPSGLPVWSCENWVIRLLHHLSQTTIPVLRLPVQTNLIYGHASRRARTLRTAPKNPQDRFAVLPLDGY